MGFHFTLYDCFSSYFRFLCYYFVVILIFSLKQHKLPARRWGRGRIGVEHFLFKTEVYSKPPSDEYGE